MQRSKIKLLDHLVGDREQPWREAEPECLGRVEVNHELELGCLHHRKVASLLALEDAADVDADLAMRIGNARAITHQAADFGGLTKRVDSRHPIESCQRRDLYATVVGQCAGTNQEC